MLRLPMKSNPSPAQRRAQQDYLARQAASRSAAMMQSRIPRQITLPRRSIEMKGMDTICSIGSIPSTVGTNVAIFPLNLLQSGTGEWARVGNRVILKSLKINGPVVFFHLRNLGDWVGNACRVCVVWDKNPNGAAIPNFDQIFANTDQSGVDSSAWSSHPRYDTMGRFVVLKDWTVTSEAAASVEANGDSFRTVVPLDCFLRLPNIESRYGTNSTPMTISDVQQGALYLITRVREEVVGTNGASLEVRTRLRYLDL